MHQACDVEIVQHSLTCKLLMTWAEGTEKEHARPDRTFRQGAFSSCLRICEEARNRSDIEHNHFIHLSIPASTSICTDWGRLQVKYSKIRRRLMRRHSHRWADVGGLESSWRESLDWLQGLRTKMCLGAATRSLYGQTKALGESLKAGGTTLGHRRCVAWVRSIAQVRMCRTLSPRPDSLSIQSHTSHGGNFDIVSEAFSAQHMPRLNYSSLLYLHIHIYNIHQRYTLCSK